MDLFPRDLEDPNPSIIEDRIFRFFIFGFALFFISAAIAQFVGKNPVTLGITAPLLEEGGKICIGFLFFGMIHPKFLSVRSAFITSIIYSAWLFAGLEFVVEISRGGSLLNAVKFISHPTYTLWFGILYSYNDVMIRHFSKSTNSIVRQMTPGRLGVLGYCIGVIVHSNYNLMQYAVSPSDGFDLLDRSKFLLIALILFIQFILYLRLRSLESHYDMALQNKQFFE